MKVLKRVLVAGAAAGCIIGSTAGAAFANQPYPLLTSGGAAPQGIAQWIRMGGADASYVVMSDLARLYNTAPGCLVQVPVGSTQQYDGSCADQDPNTAGVQVVYENDGASNASDDGNPEHDVAFNYAPIGAAGGLTQITNEPAAGYQYLEVARRGRLIVLDECRAATPVTVDLAGLDVPLHCGSVGKLHLATWTAEEFDEFVAAGLVAATDRTIVTVQELRSEVDRARRDGLAFNYQEHTLEWCGVTSAVRDSAGRDLAYLNVTLPTWTTSEADLHAWGPRLVADAQALAARVKAPLPGAAP